MTIRNSERRLIAILLRLAGLRGGAVQPVDASGLATVDATQDNVAGLANLSRSMTVKLLRRLDDDGVIRCRYRAIDLLDAVALQNRLKT